MMGASNRLGDEYMAIWAMVSLALLIGLNLLASVAVVRSASFSAAQRRAQIALIWVVPVVGGIIALAFIATDVPAHREAFVRDSGIHAGEETTLAHVPSPCGCSSDAGGGHD